VILIDVIDALKIKNIVGKQLDHSSWILNHSS